MIFLVIFVLILVSVAMSFWSLRNIQKMHEVTKAKEDLSKSKILFQRDSTLHTSEQSEQKES